MNNTKLTKTKKTVGDVFGSTLGVKQSQNIWKAGDSYYVWIGEEKTYYDVTSDYKAYLKK